MALSGPLVAGPSEAADAQLDLTPRVCALSADQDRCEEQVKVEWRTDHPQEQELCLFIDEDTAPLACWEKDREGHYRYQAKTERSLTFQLKRTLDGELLASELFEVIREYTEFRSRRRKPWNFF